MGGKLIPGSGCWQPAFHVTVHGGHLLFILDPQYTLLLFLVTSLELFWGEISSSPIMYNTGMLPSSGQLNTLLELQIRLKHGQELKKTHGRPDVKAFTQPLFLMLEPQISSSFLAVLTAHDLLTLVHQLV